MAHLSFEDELGSLLRELPHELVIADIGSGNTRYLNEIDYPNYHSFDIKDANITSDAHTLPVKTSSIDVVLSIEVLEHLSRPQVAVDEIYRILKIGGMCILTTRFLYPRHGRPWYHDFWRFTDQGLVYLFREFGDTRVKPTGGKIQVTIQMAVGKNVPRFLHDILLSKIPSDPVWADGFVVEAHK